MSNPVYLRLRPLCLILFFGKTLKSSCSLYKKTARRRHFFAYYNTTLTSALFGTTRAAKRKLVGQEQT